MRTARCSTISIGDVSNEVGGAAKAQSIVYVGNIRKQTSGTSTVTINAGKLSSSIYAALGGLSGVEVGNVSASSGGTVNVSMRDASATAAACISKVGCLSELTGKKNCIMVGNIGLASDCGNSDLINDAINELKKLGDDIKKGAEAVGKSIASGAKSIGRALGI